MVLLRSLCRSSSFFRSYRSSAALTHLRELHCSTHCASRSLFNVSSPHTPKSIPSGCRLPSAFSIGNMRLFSADGTHMPDIKDPDILNALKGLMAVNWNELPPAVISDAKIALSKDTDDKAGQEVLKNVFRAAEAVENFSGKLISLKMELDDAIGMGGENVHSLSEEQNKALDIFFQRYAAYLDSFGPDETYLRKKVETELGSHMIYLKMRCGGLKSDWGKVTVLGTSGLSGSYVEQRSCSRRPEKV